MSYRTDELQKQTAIRHRMLTNGYIPVPNYDKRCFMVGRNNTLIDAAMVDLWSTQMKNLSTGVRVEGSLVAIDIDIDDVDAIDAVTRALPDDLWGRLRLAPVRCSSARTKEAWFVRLADGEVPFSRLTSASFYHPDDPAGEDGTTHRVEIFGGDSGQQMGVFGAHTRDDSDVTVVHKEYLWGDVSLVDVPLCDLPALTRAELVLVADTASRVLTDIGWPRKLLSKAGFTSPQVIYDINDDTVFETLGGQLSLPELMDEAIGVSGVRISASFHSPGSHNTSRCIASLGHDNKLRIIDFETANTHRHASDAPKPMTTGALDRLQALTAAGSMFAPSAAAAPAPTSSEVGLAMRGEMEDVVEALLNDVAFCPSEQRCVMPIDGGPERAMSIGNFSILMKPWAVEVRGQRGGSQMINPASLWSSDLRRIVVGGHRFRPDLSGQRLVTGDGGQQFINTYREPVLEVASDAAVAASRAAFEALMCHLMPNELDRDWFRMWIAAKVQRPWVPNCGVIMVAEQQGTGRGTLFDMISPALGRQYVRSISSTELMGGSGQGQYNEWLASSTLVLCEEVMAGDDAGGAMTWKRREVYERLKQLVDPRQRIMEIRRKGLQNYSTEVFASILMATNHLNALPLDRNDRRIAVLVQPEMRFEDVPSLKALVDPHRASGRFSDAFASGLRSYLLSVDVDFDALRIAPELSGGRADMRENNESDLDMVLSSVLGDIPGDFVTNAALKRRLKTALTASGDIDHVRSWWVRACDAIKRPNDFGWRRMRVRQVTSVNEGGKRGVETVYYREGGAGEGAWEAMSWSERGEALRHADDMNDKLTRLDAALHEGRIGVA